MGAEQAPPRKPRVQRRKDPRREELGTYPRRTRGVTLGAVTAALDAHTDVVATRHATLRHFRSNRKAFFSASR